MNFAEYLPAKLIPADAYRDRAALNGKAQERLATGSRQVTIRLSNSEMASAKQQAEAKGLRYHAYPAIGRPFWAAAAFAKGDLEIRTESFPAKPRG